MVQATVGQARLFWDAAPEQAYQYLLNEVNRAVAGGAYNPPMLAEAAVEALRLCKDPHVSMERIEHLVASDAPTAARLLSLANSPIYRGNEPFTSLRAALVRVGTVNLRDVLAQAVVTSHVFNVQGFKPWMVNLAMEAAGVAYACGELAKEVGSGEHYAFMAGLLHDLGKTILLQIASRFSEGRTAPGDALHRLLESEHARVGRDAARRMNLAAPIACAIARHHETELDPDDNEPAMMVALARRIWGTTGTSLPCDGSWPEIPALDLVDYQVIGVLEKVAAARPRLAALGALLEGERVDSVTGRAA